MNKYSLLKLRIKIQQFGSALVFFGLALLINKIPGGKLITIIGGMLYASSRIMRALEPIYTEPIWELVFPELALGTKEQPEMNNSDKTH